MCTKDAVFSSVCHCVCLLVYLYVSRIMQTVFIKPSRIVDHCHRKNPLNSQNGQLPVSLDFCYNSAYLHRDMRSSKDLLLLTMNELCMNYGLGYH